MPGACRAAPSLAPTRLTVPLIASKYRGVGLTAGGWTWVGAPGADVAVAVVATTPDEPVLTACPVLGLAPARWTAVAPLCQPRPRRTTATTTLSWRDEQRALDRAALLDEWYLKNGPYEPRDEITLRRFEQGDRQRMQIGPIGPQTRGPDVPDVRPDGTPIPLERPGGATQYVAGRDQPEYESVADTWSGPPPWVRATPEHAWADAGRGAAVGLGTSTVTGAAAETER